MGEEQKEGRGGGRARGGGGGGLEIFYESCFKNMYNILFYLF